MDKGKTTKRDCKQESFSEEVAEHTALWKHSPKFRAAVEKRTKGKSDRKAMGKR